MITLFTYLEDLDGGKEVIVIFFFPWSVLYFFIGHIWFEYGFVLTVDMFVMHLEKR